MNLTSFFFKAVCVVVFVFLTACASKQSTPDLLQQADKLLIESELQKEFDQGISLLAKAELNQAKSIFEQINEQHPDYIGPLLNLGVIARQEGRFDEAEAFYRKVLSLDAQNQIALRNLGILLDLYRGRLAEALALYEQYQNLQAKPNPKLKDWIFDIKSRIKLESKE